jgi:ABC-type transport system substrate-binding protein
MSTSNWKKALTVAASVGVLGMVLAGCGTSPTNSTSPGSTTTKPVEGGSITIDETQGLRDLDPAKAYDTQSDEIVQQLYDRLVTYAPGDNNTKLVPMDATKWTISPDGKTYTFTIRKGMKFWDGSPVTAQSFIDEITRVDTKSIASGGQGFITSIAGAEDYYNGKAKSVSGLSAPDPYTLKIQLTQPDPQMLYVLGMPFFSAVEKSYIDKVGAKTFDATEAMGSGPFKLGSINSSGAVLIKNPHYWMKDQYGQALPYLDKVTIRINSNAQLDALNFEQGQTAFLGFVQSIPTSAFPHFMSTPSLKKLTHKVINNDVYYIGLNNNIAPFNNPKVRQAVEYAINKQNIIKLVNGRGIVANQPLPPALPGYVKNLPADATYSYNPTKAKQMLKAAGVKSGTPITLYTTSDPDSMKIAESQQNDLQAVGFKVSIKGTSWATFLNTAEAGKAQVFDLGWFQDFPDAGDFLMLFESSQAPLNNSAMYKNPQVDQWMQESGSTTDQAKRVQLFQQITDQVMKDAPWVPTYYPVGYSAVQSWVHGFYVPAVNSDPLETIWVDKSHSQG